MRFCEHLQAHLTPEWRTQYIEYEELRDVIVKMAEDAPKDGAQLHTYFDECDLSFYNIWLPELQKIDNFFEEKLAEARRKFVTLKNELVDYQEQLDRRTSVWQSLTALASTGDKIKKSKNRETNRERVRKANLEMAELGGPNSVIAGLTRRISTANFQQVIQRTQARRQEIRREKRQVRKLHDIKLGFSEFYLSLVLLQNYQTLNFTGFRKLFKKHDKLFGRTSGAQWLSEYVDRSDFHQNKEVDQLIVKVETVYTKELEQGDRGRAMKRLRVPPLSEKQNPWTTFRVGFLFGILSVLVLAILLIGAIHRPVPGVWVPAVRIFRATFLVSLFLLLIGANSYGWTTAGVNHVLIFEIDPRHHLTHQDYMEVGGFLLILWATAVVYFLYSVTLSTPSYLAPFLLCLFYVFFLMNPLRCFHYKARRWLLRVLKRIFLAPLYSVSFADFWLADQLNSLAVVFVDCVFCVCFFVCQIDWISGFVPFAMKDPSTMNASRPLLDPSDHLKSDTWPFIDSRGGFCAHHIYGLMPIVRCLPAWFRLAQCLRRYYDMEERAPFPHLVNAGKYSCTFFVVLLGTLSRVVFSDSTLCLILWLICLIVATVYTYAWDILMDWGLFDVNEPNTTGRCSARSMLRDELVYRHSIVYHLAMIEDLLLRLSWIVDVVLTHFKVVDGEVMTCLLSLGEVLRRFVWNFFRLENEHLNNCGQFRAVRDICIAPISSQRSPPKRAPMMGADLTSIDEQTDCMDNHLSSGGKQHHRTADTPSRYRAKGHMFGSRGSLDRSAHYYSSVGSCHGHTHTNEHADSARTSLIVNNSPQEEIPPVQVVGSANNMTPSSTSLSVKFQIEHES